MQAKPFTTDCSDASGIIVADSAPVGRDAKRPRLAQISTLCNAQTLLLSIANTRPQEALNLLERNLPRCEEARKQWVASARGVAAVMGSCPRSLASFKSGLKHWIKFVSIIHGTERADDAAFPPCMDDILAWSNTFRCESVAFATNYMF